MKQKVDLLLVNPGNRLEQFAKLSDLATVAQPLGLAIMASVVRNAGYSVAIVDGEVNFWTPEQTVAECEKYEPLLLGLSAFTTKMTSAGKILTLVKEKMPGVLTIIGGHHSSAIPEQTLREEDVDYVVQGEGYVTLVDLLNALKKGDRKPAVPGLWFWDGDKPVGHGRAPETKNLDELPFAAWDLLPMDMYRAHHWQAWDYGLDQTGFALIHTSLGCPYSCDYCSVNVVYEKHHCRYRSVEKVVAELRLLVDTYKVKHVEIIDDTFTLNQKRVETLCDAIAAEGLGSKLNMWCFARTDRLAPAFLAKMKNAGVNWVFMGFESGDDGVLQGVHKRQTVDGIRKATDVVHDAGIHIGGNYVFGLPNDNLQTMQNTLDLAKDLNTEYANFFILMGYPGTALREVALQRGYALPEKWGQYGFFAPDALPMRNEQISSEDILRFRDRAFKEYFNSDKYQEMMLKIFGPGVLEFMRNKVLTKNIVRTRLPEYSIYEQCPPPPASN